MFSPYYALSGGDAENHCALNVVLYGAPSRWTMTERGRAAVRRDAGTLAIGPSSMTWDGTALTVRIEERGCPLPRAVRGTVRVVPQALTGYTAHLDAAGRHRWSPLAPASRVEVDFATPALRWSGPGYFDHNAGDRPMQEDFARWDWSRAPWRDGAAITYDVTRRDGSRAVAAIGVDGAGEVRDLPIPPVFDLRGTRWGVARQTRAAAARVRQTLVDAPFYARSVLESEVAGESVVAMHETLSLDRFRAPWVRAMLPFRIPRTFI